MNSATGKHVWNHLFRDQDKMDSHRSEEALVECAERQMARPPDDLFQNYNSVRIIFPLEKQIHTLHWNRTKDIGVRKLALCLTHCSRPAVAPEDCPLKVFYSQLMTSRTLTYLRQSTHQTFPSYLGNKQSKTTLPWPEQHIIQSSSTHPFKRQSSILFSKLYFETPESQRIKKK